MTSEPISPENSGQDSEPEAPKDNAAAPLTEIAEPSVPADVLGAEPEPESGAKLEVADQAQAMAELPLREMDGDTDDADEDGPQEPSAGSSVPLTAEQLENVIEASLLVASRALSLGQLEAIFEHDSFPPSREEITAALAALHERYEGRGIELSEVATGYRLQSRQELSPWIGNLFQEKSPRYSRALLETLVLIAYRQPITRGEIEEVRGVAVSTNIIRTLLEREWVKVVGHRDVPGRPAIYGTTRQFLDYFDLAKIGELPTLSEIKELDQIAPELAQEVAMLEAAEVANDESAEQAGDQSEQMPEGLSAEEQVPKEPAPAAPLDENEASLDASSERLANIAESDSVDEDLVEPGFTDPESTSQNFENGSSSVEQALVVDDEGDLRLDEQEVDAREIDVDLSIADEAEMPDVRESTIDSLSTETERDLETLH